MCKIIVRRIVLTKLFTCIPNMKEDSRTPSYVFMCLKYFKGIFDVPLIIPTPLQIKYLKKKIKVNVLTYTGEQTGRQTP